MKPIRKVCNHLWMTERGLSVIGPGIPGYHVLDELPQGCELDLTTGVATLDGQPHATLFPEEIEGVTTHVARHVRVMTQVTERVSVVGG